MFAGVGSGPIHDSGGLLKRVRELIDRARADGVPLIYVQHNDAFLQKGSARWEFHREIAPRPGDTVVEKTRSDAFLDTRLAEVLQERGLRRLVVVGAQSEFCVDTTCRRASSEGYEVVLVADGHSTFDLGELTAEQIVRHHNQVLGAGFATLVSSGDVEFGQ